MTTTIILADDHDIFRQGLASLLHSEQEFALLEQACNGQEAWELILELNPDVAILDVTMPEMTGIEVVRKSYQSGLDTSAVLLTMHDDPCALLEAQEAGAAGYILKDNSFEELVTAVRTVVAGGTFITPSLRKKLRELQCHGHAPIQLSKREREVIKLIALGKSSKEIARLLGISPRTVDTYRQRLMSKLALNNLADVVRYAVRAGLAS
ncbi:MAG: response regulator transcription factor [Pseudomonadota bacterium]